jgi:FlaA1/EpsC-like NDP-sugar epimerase
MAEYLFNILVELPTGMNIVLGAIRLMLRKSMNRLCINLLCLRNRHLFIGDLCVFCITPLLALFLTLDNKADLQVYILGLKIVTLLFLAIKITLFWNCGFYRRYWRYASIEELIYISKLVTSALIIQIILFQILSHLLPSIIARLPYSLPVIDGLLSCVFIGGIRFSLRVMEQSRQRQAVSYTPQDVLIIGAGSAGVSLVQDMYNNPQLGFHPVGFIDDDPRKLNAYIRGVPVLGDRHQISEIVESRQINKAIIAMPTVAGEIIREIVDICTASGIKTSTLPGIHEILSDRVRVNSIRDVKIEDLLRREPIQTDIQRVFAFIKGKKVLITGAGGSIGSELCRQILKCQPAHMILIGHGENSLFNIQQELEQMIQVLKKNHKFSKNTPDISSFVGDIRLRNRLENAFEKFRPDVVFHAAAHKHVPLMELNPSEAITNNVTGTKNLVDLAVQYDVKHFVMISTDKAVNPTNVMGASKRVAEMLVLQVAKATGKSYVCVRFGNVLGSRGSVIPTFQKQIAAGGPITVTHPDIRRYFMTIPEAVQLVLQAAVLGRSGEVLMLNMGQPVKIVDLAKELIRLSGYEVNKDIDIVFTGLRPGEKLFEELFIEGEEYAQTEHEKLFIVKNASRMVPDNLPLIVDFLCKAAAKNASNSIVFLLEQLVPSYKPQLQKNNKPIDTAKNSELTTVMNSSIIPKIEAKSV